MPGREHKIIEMLVTSRGSEFTVEAPEPKSIFTTLCVRADGGVPVAHLLTREECTWLADELHIAAGGSEDE